MQASLSLKPGRERPLLQRHHWIYSGAIKRLPEHEEGQPVLVYSHGGELLGQAFLNPGHSIAGHMIAYGSESIPQALESRIDDAISLRRSAIDISKTNAYRLINAEGDGLPGLIIDIYGEVVVVQIASRGMEKLKGLIVDILVKLLKPAAIYEKSTSFLRKKDGLEEAKQKLYGQDQPVFQIVENGVRFEIDLFESQKTGLFLDQREMRSLTERLSNKKRVLNCFAYSGGFSLFALKGGAISVDSVEISKKACAMMQKNIQINAFSEEKHRIICEDAFDFLMKNPLPYDLVILDPPAFVKKRDDLVKARRAYRDINFFAMQKMPASALLLTSSCSYHLSEEAFQQVLFQAALEAKKKVRILSRHLQAFDHPLSIYHPESTYLKSFLLHIA